MRLVLSALSVFLLVGCAMPSVYGPLPRAVRASVSRDFPGCRDPRGFVRDPDLVAPGADAMRYEVRSCGQDAVYFCPSGTGRGATCVLEGAIATAGAEAPMGAYVVLPPVAEPASIEAARGHGREIERLVLEREGLSLDGPIALTVASPALVAGGLVLAAYEGLRGACFSFWGSCTRTIYPDEGVVAAGLAMAGVGAVLTVAGGIWWGVVRHQRREATDRIEDACTAIAFGLSPSYTGVAFSQCFP